MPASAANACSSSSESSLTRCDQTVSCAGQTGGSMSTVMSHSVRLADSVAAVGRLVGMPKSDLGDQAARALTRPGVGAALLAALGVYGVLVLQSVLGTLTYV